MRIVERKLALGEFKKKRFKAYRYPCFFAVIDDDFLPRNRIDHVIVLDLFDALVGPEPSEYFRRRIEGLVGRGERHIVLNLTGLKQVDSMGLGEIARAVTVLSKNDGSLPLVNVPTHFHQLVTRMKFV